MVRKRGFPAEAARYHVYARLSFMDKVYAVVYRNELAETFLYAFTAYKPLIHRSYSDLPQIVSLQGFSIQSKYLIVLVNAAVIIL